MINALLFLFAGIVMWTFMEYLIHRFLGHQKRGKNPVRKEHKRHHAEAHYFAPLYKKLFLATLFFTFSTVVTGLLFTFQMGIYFSLGLAGMYFIYEITHRRFHIKEPLIRYGLRMRKHHFFHHFGNPSVNHGVTTALWDRIFGTFKRPDVVKVPDQMTMIWLKDEQQQLKKRYTRHFRIH
jgi:sterol desaturase/sphingolipid hydroxylase (fatty acid hydroxylase superfamily)